MKSIFPHSSILKPPDRDLEVAKQLRTSFVILGCHFAFMFALAFALPATYEGMPWVLPVVEFVAKWAPNVRLVALRTSAPPLFEAYLSIGLIATLIAAAIGIGTIRGYAYVQFQSGFHKSAMVIASILFTILIGTFYFWPGMVSGELGLLHGRSGAVFAIALSGRLGMATFLNFFCCSALLLGLIALWASIKEPVAPAIDLAHYLISSHAKDH